MDTQTVFDTKPLLRPTQVESAKDEIKNLEAKLQNKHIEDKAEVQREVNARVSRLIQRQPAARIETYPGAQP